jgi:hypothetical protein
VAVYLKKRFPDDWADRMTAYNAEMAKLDVEELHTITKSIGRPGKSYNYSCKQPPINDFCNRRKCLSCEFGVGDAGSQSIAVEIMNVVRYDHPPPDPPMWSFELNGRRVMVDNDTFYSKDMMNKACLAQANCIPLHCPPAKWLLRLNGLIQSADVLEMPSEAGPTGQMWERVCSFIDAGVNALSREEVFLGKVFKDGDKAYFRSEDLFAYFKRRSIKYKSEQEVYQLLREHGVERHKWNISDLSRGNVWSLPCGATTPDVGPRQMSIPKEDDFTEQRMEEF